MKWRGGRARGEGWDMGSDSVENDLRNIILMGTLSLCTQELLVYIHVAQQDKQRFIITHR